MATARAGETAHESVVGKRYQDHHYTMSISTTSTPLLNTSRDGDSATSLGSLFQCLTTLSVKKFFLISSLNLPWCNLRPFPLVLSLVTWEKRPTPALLQPPFRELLNNPSSLSRSSQDLCSRPFTSFLALLWTRSSTSMSLFAEYRGTITSLVLLATLFLIQARMLLPFLATLGTLLAHIQLAINQHPQVLFCQAAFQPLFPGTVALQGVVVTQVQDLALGLVEPHTIGLGPLIHPVQVPLQSLPTLKQINTPAQLGVICKLTEGALDPLVQIIDKDVKQNWPQHRALGDTTCDRPPTGVNSIHHHSLGPAIQTVFYPAKSTPFQAMSSQFLQENAVGDSVKGFTKV
ncbi:hypothetical protein QYF61_018636 [Mycteria americana]|uniref:Uncharacterized protein n=1 Tax=Mycteria americana TaxID=33587 RepID=A0AAN7NWI7_MYCAM|nr:hypothetical protein QYF61_018636 [Mycteria americana]